MLPDGGLKLVILAGQPIEIGEELCMLFTFADLEPRQKAQNALAQSEERFAKAFRLAPVPMLIYAAEDRRITSINEAFLSTIGYASEQVIGKTEDELELWADDAIRRKVVAGVEAGSVRALDVGVQTAEGHTLACLLSADTVFINGQACVLSVLQDVSDRRHSESELVDAIESVMQDTTWFGRSVVERLANLRVARGSNKPRPELADLTVREREVLGLLCRGDSDQSLSEALGVTRNTVRNHIARIYAKIGVHRRGEVIVWARERGFDGASEKARTKPT